MSVLSFEGKAEHAPEHGGLWFGSSPPPQVPIEVASSPSPLTREAHVAGPYDNTLSPYQPDLLRGSAPPLEPPASPLPLREGEEDRRIKAAACSFPRRGRLYATSNQGPADPSLRVGINGKSIGCRWRIGSTWSRCHQLEKRTVVLAFVHLRVEDDPSSTYRSVWVVAPEGRK